MQRVQRLTQLRVRDGGEHAAFWLLVVVQIRAHCRDEE